MGAGQEDTAGMPTKSSKSTSSAQEGPSTPTTPAYPDWSSSMQAFYGAGATPPFFASTVASPTPHPFLWGSQHPLMPPYGTPVPYPALYPPGGVYAYPNMVMPPGNIHGTAELDGKATERKDRASSKTTKGTSGNHSLSGGKIGDGGKTASGSGNDIGTQSAESGSEGSSDASDDNNQEYTVTKKGSFDQMHADGFGSRHSRQNPPGVSPIGAPSSMMNDRSIQDERELKRQRRKLSNRESARRSRLRKQAECEELHRKVETLSDENRALSDELQRLSQECEKLASENNSLKEQLTAKCGK